MAQRQQLVDALFSGSYGCVVRHPHGDGAQVVLANHAVHGRGVGHKDVQAFAAGAKAAVFLLGYTNHTHRHSTHQDHFTHRVGGVGEEFGAGVVVNHGHLRALVHCAAVKRHTLRELDVFHPEVLLTHTRGGAGDGHVAVTHGVACGDVGRHAVHVALVGQCVGVGRHQRAHGGRAHVAKTGA